MRRECDSCGETLDDWNRSNLCDTCAYLDDDDDDDDGLCCENCNEPLGPEDEECDGLCCDCYEEGIENGDFYD